MRGSNGSVAGASGYPPIPAAADNVKYLKGDGTWSALSNASAATDAEASAGTSTTTFVTPANAGLAVAKVINARAPRQGFAFTGSAVSATATLGSAIGASDASIEFEIDVPNANPSATKTAFHLASGRSEGTAYEIALTLLTSGQLIFFFRGATGGDSRYAGVTSNLVTTWGGQRIKGMITRTGATLAIKINDVTVAYTEVTAGTPPAWSAAWTGILLTLGQHGVSYSWDGFLAIRIWNRLLTAAEQTNLYQNGAPAAGDYPSSAAGTVITKTLALGTWTGSVAGSTYTVSTSSTGFISGGLVTYGQLPRGKIRVNYDLTINSGAGPAFGDGNTFTSPVLVSGTGKTVEFTNPIPGNQLFLVNAFYAGNYVVTVNSITVIGLLLAPDSAQSGGGLTWYDTSGNAANITLPATGVTWNVPTSGNLTSSGALNLRAGGTAQNITLAPSGSGGVLIGGGNYFSYTAGALALNVNATSSTVSEIKLTNSTTGNAATAGILLSCDGNNGYVWNGQPTGTLNFGTANAYRAQFLANGRFLIGTASDSGALLQVGANAATGYATAGMSFGGDTYLFRQSSTQMRLLGTTTNEGLWIQQSDAVTGIIVQTNAGVGSVETTAAGQSLVLKSGAQVTALTLDASQNATFAGNISTSGVLSTSSVSGFGITAFSSTWANLGVGTTVRSSLRIGHGVAPTSPVDGDMWTTTAGAFIRINGVTKTFTLT